MNQANRLFNNFLQQIAELPAVKQMVHEENVRTDADILKARKDCITLVKSTGIQLTEAQKNLTSAVEELKAAEEKLMPYRDRLVAADKSLSVASSTYQAAAQKLHLEHGESHITRTLNQLDSMGTLCKQQIADLSECMKPEYFANGQWHFRVVHPTIQQANQQDLEKFQRELEAIEKSISAARLLVMAEMTPGELKTKTDALLRAAGYVQDTVKYQP